MSLPTKMSDVSPVAHASASAAASASKKTLFKRVLGVGIGLSCAVVAGMGLYGSHGQAFQHGSERFLAELASASGVHVTLTPKTGSDYAPSGLTIDGFLFPRTTTSGALTFDGRLSYIHVGSQYNFTLLDGRGFVTVQDQSTGALTTNQCLYADNIPPLNTFTDALLDARVIDDGSAFNVQCSGGNLVEFMFANEAYVFCSKAGVSVSSIVGEDIKAAFELLTENSEDFPTVDSLSPQGLDISQCELLDSASASSSSTSGRKLLEKTVQRSKDVYNVLSGSTRRSLASTCGCEGGLKTCLFVHGLGYYEGETTDSFPAYFGDIEQRQQCCSSTKFIHLDTVGKTWYDDSITDKLCAVAAEVTGSSKDSLENLALVAHSMGNLIVSSAFSKGSCKLASSSKYIALNGPIYGSMSATTGVKTFQALAPSVQTALCSKTLVGPITNPLLELLGHNGLCPVQTAITSMAYMGSAISTLDLDQKFVAAAKAYVENVGSNMCGVSATGLVSSDSALMAANGLISGHASSQNDGEVEITSCRTTLDLNKYSTSFDGGNFYKASINHLDGAFRHGDGWWGADRKPVKWFNCQF